MTKYSLFCLNLFSAFFTCLPRRVQLWMGDFVGFLWFDVFRIRRSVALGNLRLAYPEWTEQERVRVARLSLFNIGRCFFEYFVLLRLNSKNISRYVSAHNEEHIKKALAQDKGVLLLTLHLGNGDLGCAGLSQLGYKMNLITKEFKLKWLNDIWFEMRSRQGTKLIGARKSHYDILKALKRKEIVAFVLDQHMGPPLGVKNTFFGRNVGAALGLSVIAARTRAPVVPAYTHRLPNGHLGVHFLPEIPFVESEDHDKTLAMMTQRYTDCVESMVRLHPDQWMWIHKRFKGFRES
jgi:KDO2-lipid IV(A) lauroyltransferase